jgi:FlaA1/EpsC-like NDP-sugar epimerase
LKTKEPPLSEAGLSLGATWRRTVLIGTVQTLDELEERVTDLGVHPVGRFVVDPDDTAAAKAQSLDALLTLHAIEPVTGAVVSLAASMGPAILRVRAMLRASGIVERFVPTLCDILSGAAPPAVRTDAIDVVELIGRTPYGIDRRSVERALHGKRVLVTGAGGSIGSELCRIAATFRPELLVLMERSENALFEVDRQLARRFPDVPRKAILHDIVDAEQTLRHLVALKPHAVFHAAAHKHVPLMEDHPAHAVTNNLFGTKSIADASVAVGAERFVMISSDKAVNPTSVMGATKRLAEMYVQGLGTPSQRNGRTALSMVRFGNVLGSACSVLPIWSNQLAEGGPITVTDPRMTRYFMTINEAAMLVIQAGAMDAGGPPAIFVLDMGAPVRIAELAERFVRLHGFEPRVIAAPGMRLVSGQAGSVDIVFTGARPGEKIHEELAYQAEALQLTGHPGIMMLTAGPALGFDAASLVADLSGVRASSDAAAVIAAIRRHVPEMAAQAPRSAGSRTLAAA